METIATPIDKKKAGSVKKSQPKAKVEKAGVVRPGSHGGQWHYDKRGNIRYGPAQSVKAGGDKDDHGEVEVTETGAPRVHHNKQEGHHHAPHHTAKSLSGIEVYVVPEAEIWQLTNGRRADADLVLKAWRGVHSALAKALFGDYLPVMEDRIRWFASKHKVALPYTKSLLPPTMKKAATGSPENSINDDVNSNPLDEDLDENGDMPFEEPEDGDPNQEFPEDDEDDSNDLENPEDEVGGGVV